MKLSMHDKYPKYAGLWVGHTLKYNSSKFGQETFEVILLNWFDSNQYERGRGKGFLVFCLRLCTTTKFHVTTARVNYSGP